MNWFKKHKIITVIIALALVGIVVSAGSGSKSSSTADNAASSSSKPKTDTAKAATIGLNQAARDGKFEFTVASISCGEASVSDSSGYLTKPAQGQFCSMAISVKNIGDKQQYFSEGDQKILNASNVQYSTDSTATLYKGGNNDVFLSQINPGNTATGTLVFDIPKDQTPVTAELHDSSLSSGVKVKLN